MRRILWREVRRTTAWLVFFCAMVAGVGLAHTVHSPNGLWCVFFGAVTLATCRRRTVLYLLTVLVFGLLCGWWRGSDYNQQLSNYDSLQYQHINFTARAMNDALYNKTKQLSFDA